MLPEPVTQVTLVLLVVGYMIDKLLPWILKVRNGDPVKKTCADLSHLKRDAETSRQDILAIKRWVGELHKWHDKEDADGRKVWYVPQSLEQAVEKLADSITTQTQVLQNIVHAQEAMSKELEELRRQQKKS